MGQRVSDWRPLEDLGVQLLELLPGRVGADVHAAAIASTSLRRAMLVTVMALLGRGNLY